MLAAAAGLDAVEVARVSLGGFLHDLGKIGVPDAILCKSAPLTDAEWAVMRTHPDIGMRLLAAHPPGLPGAQRHWLASRAARRPWLSQGPDTGSHPCCCPHRRHLRRL
ncbi:HD-GYP domain-containing protein [Thiomonas sp.]